MAVFLPYVFIGRESVTVSSTSIGITNANSEKVVYAVAQIDKATIRYAEDGTDPVADTTGNIAYQGDELHLIGSDPIKNFRMIREQPVDAVVEVTYWGEGGS